MMFLEDIFYLFYVIFTYFLRIVLRKDYTNI